MFTTDHDESLFSASQILTRIDEVDIIISHVLNTKSFILFVTSIVRLKLEIGSKCNSDVMTRGIIFSLYFEHMRIVRACRHKVCLVKLYVSLFRLVSARPYIANLLDERE